MTSDLVVTRHPDLPARILRLHAPRRRNALTAGTVEHLERILEEDRDEILAIGSSTPGIFCAGADLAAENATRATLSDRLYACYELMVSRPGPVLAIVEGPAVGGGAQLSSAADLRIASQEARWRWVGPRHGLAVGGWVLPELLGRSRALDLTMTGRWLNASEAASVGFATFSKEPWTLAEAIVRQLAEADAAALGRLKQVTLHQTLVDRLRHERAGNAPWSGTVPSGRDAPGSSP